MKTVICDLDGTLADTSGDLIAAANACFVADGLGALLDAEADKLTAFHGGRAMLQLGLRRAGINDPKKIDAQYPQLLEYYAENINVHTRLYPGVRQALEEMLAAGYRLGICTNKPSGLAEQLLQKLEVRDYFGSMIGADTLPVRKPDPAPYLAAVRDAGGDPGNSFLVGDTETDVKTARAAGVPVVLVSFGPEGEGVSRLKPDALLPHYAELGWVAAEVLEQS